MNKIKKTRILILAIMIILLQACSVSSKNIKKNVLYEEEISKVKKIGIIGDMFIKVDRIKDADDFYVIDESLASSQAMVNGMANYLKDKGYKIGIKSSPFVCGTYNKRVRLRMGQNVNSDGSNKSEVFTRELSLVVDKSIDNDIEYQESLLNIYKKIKRYFTKNSLILSKIKIITDPMKKLKTIDTGVFLEDLKVIHDKTGEDTLLFVFGYGTTVSAAKIALQKLAGLGVVLGSIGTLKLREDHDFLSLKIVLINMKSGEFIWANKWYVSNQEDPMDKSIYKKKVPKKLLYHFYKQKRENKD